MKRQFLVCAVFVLFAFVLLSAAGCGDGDSSKASVRVNGEFTGGVVRYSLRGQGCLVDAEEFSKQLPGVAVYPCNGNAALAIQYGGRMSFAGVGFVTGFCALQEVTMEPPVEVSDGAFWAPLNFFAQSVSGEISFLKTERIIDVTMPEPQRIGDIIPETKKVAEALDSAFITRQAATNLASAIELFAAGYTSDCNGNNAGFPYVILQAPPSPRTNIVEQLPIVYQMDNDEAFVFVGRTPPECAYYSYRSYLVNRYYEDDTPPARKKIYASLGDTINNYNITRYHGYVEPYESPIVIISTGNVKTQEAVRAAVIQAGISEDRILYDIMPADTVRFGLDSQADGFNFLHRTSVFSNEQKGQAYTAQPTLEALRVTPRDAMEFVPLDAPPLIERATGITEDDVNDQLPGAVALLRTAIINRYGSGYQYHREMDTTTWLIEGQEAIEEGVNVLGETRDTLYSCTKSFTLEEEDLIVVFGVNHNKTAKAVYGNVSIYGAEYFNGFGGITNLAYQGTALGYLPDMDPELAGMLYVYKFARTALDDQTFAIPRNIDNSYMGLNDGDAAFMGFRAYVDVTTTVGTIIDEIVRDQAILFTNTAPQE